MTNLLMAAGAGFYFASIPDTDDPLTVIVCIVLAISAVIGHYSDRREERHGR